MPLPTRSLAPLQVHERPRASLPVYGQHNPTSVGVVLTPQKLKLMHEAALSQQQAYHAIALLDDSRRSFRPQLEAQSVSSLPRAIDRLDEIREYVAGKRLVIFCDYDGTLTPIVDDPDRALLSSHMRAAVSRLSEVKPVAIVSGRGREKVQNFVKLSSLYYAGSHGFDIAGPGGLSHRVGEAVLPLLAEVRDALRERLATIKGAAIEDNGFSISVHWRNTPPEYRQTVEEATREEVHRRTGLQWSSGKCVYEIRPLLPNASAWNKGEAVRFLLEYLLREATRGFDMRENDDREVVPVYIGDDVTDEDAFRALHELGGLSFLVARTDDTERPRTTFGTHRLDDCDEVGALLQALASM